MIKVVDKLILMMRIDELDYTFPHDLIADRPAEPRESCRLLVVHRDTGELEHRHFFDLPGYLRRGDLLVLNSARVAPARLRATLLDGDHPHNREILVTNAGESARCHALIHPAKHVREGHRLALVSDGLICRVCGRQDRGWLLELEDQNRTWRSVLEQRGEMPLPPYILKKRCANSDLPEDRDWYQTVYADREGAIAAPTAGLHFSSNLLERIEMDGIASARLFLRVGLGTFQPIRVTAVERHSLAPEEFDLGSETANRVNATRPKNGRVVAVGTTVVRTLEHCAGADGLVQPCCGVVDLLILPPYRFRAVDALITNFHLPRTTLLALVYAFAGTELARRAYEVAVRERYRFYSYGDAMLIL